MHLEAQIMFFKEGSGLLQPVLLTYTGFVLILAISWTVMVISPPSFVSLRKWGQEEGGTREKNNFLYYVFAILFWMGSPPKWLLPTSH